MVSLFQSTAPSGHVVIGRKQIVSAFFVFSILAGVSFCLGYMAARLAG
jgi:hypothetical protein